MEAFCPSGRFSLLPARRTYENQLAADRALIHGLQNFFTNVWLYDGQNLKQINATMEMVADILERRCIDTSSIEVGLDLSIDDDGNKLGCYYVCNKNTEEVFWLHRTENTFFYEGEDVKILGREHLRESDACSRS